MIKSPLASHIEISGRAYLQVGTTEDNLRPFQCVYSGEKSPSKYSQLDELVQQISKFCKEEDIVKLPIYLPPLERTIPFIDSHCPISGIPIGIYDYPQSQCQGIYSIDFESSNMLIVGSEHSGKSNLLQVIIRSCASQFMPSDVNIYVIDSTSMALKGFEQLGVVGGVVSPLEKNRLNYLEKYLLTQIENRVEIFSRRGVTSYLEYKKPGASDLPHIILLIDDLTALFELYIKDDDWFMSLCQLGLSCGITIIATAPYTSGISNKYLQCFSSKIAMFCNDSDEYRRLFNTNWYSTPNIPGRCIVEFNKILCECQIYNAFEGDDEIEKTKNIEGFMVFCNEKSQSLSAHLIPAFPKILSTDYVMKNYVSNMSEPYKIVIGLDYRSFNPVVLDLRTVGHFIVSGKRDSGKYNFLRYLIKMTEKLYHDKNERHIIDSIEQHFLDVQGYSNVATYELDPTKIIEKLKQIELRLKLRYDSIIYGAVCDEDSEQLLVLMINSQEAINIICKNRDALNAYMNILEKYKSLNICVILGEIENTSVTLASSEILKKARDIRKCMFFDDIDNMRILDLPISVIRNNRGNIVLGDCFFIDENQCTKFKTVVDL